MIDFKNLSVEQENQLRKLIAVMQETVITDLSYLKEVGAQILTFDSDKPYINKAGILLDFKKMDEETAKNLSAAIQIIQKSLLKELQDEKGDPDEKGIFVSSPRGALNLSRNDVIKEVSDLTPIGICILQNHWEYINIPFDDRLSWKFIQRWFHSLQRFFNWIWIASLLICQSFLFQIFFKIDIFIYLVILYVFIIITIFNGKIYCW